MKALLYHVYKTDMQVPYSTVYNEVLLLVSKLLTSWSNSSTLDSKIRNSSFNWLIVSPRNGSIVNDERFYIVSLLSFDIQKNSTRKMELYEFRRKEFRTPLEHTSIIDKKKTQLLCSSHKGDIQLFFYIVTFRPPCN